MDPRLEAHAHFSAILASFVISWELRADREQAKADRLRAEKDTKLDAMRHQPRDQWTIDNEERNFDARIKICADAVASLKLRIEAAKNDRILLLTPDEIKKVDGDPVTSWLPNSLIRMATQTERYKVI